jgi:hypothetical protein
LPAICVPLPASRLLAQDPHSMHQYEPSLACVNNFASPARGREGGRSERDDMALEWLAGLFTCLRACLYVGCRLLACVPWRVCPERRRW